VTRTGRIVLIALAVGLAVLGQGCGRGPDLGACARAGRRPRIRPDYTDVVIPPNIAPLNFTIDEPGTRFHVRITGEAGGDIEVNARGPVVRIPPAEWRRLLDGNRGRGLQVDVCAESDDGRWIRYETIANRVAEEPIDRYVTYRLITPAFFWFRDSIEMGVYQRDMESFEETPILRSASCPARACMNCHACAGNRASLMVLQLRGSIGPGMLVMRGGQAERVETSPWTRRGPVSLASLHPGGELLAFCRLKIEFFNNNAGTAREVFERASDIDLYRFDGDEFRNVPALSSPEYSETWPAWSGDGKHLYFCRTPIRWPSVSSGMVSMLPRVHREIRYDLMRVAYERETDAWGTPERVLAGEQLGGSIAQPAVSPDGRFVVLCMLDRGMWPLTCPTADLHLLDTKTGAVAALACNSDRSESSPRWSSNGRWVLFSSKRNDGVFTRLYVAYVDRDGRSAKALELPQRSPALHARLLKAYNLPQLLVEPVPFSEGELVDVVGVTATPRPNVMGLHTVH